MHTPLHHQQLHYDDLQRGLTDVSTAVGRAAVEFAMQYYYRQMANRPVRVEVTAPLAREQVEQVHHALNQGISLDRLQDAVMEYAKKQDLNPEQQQDYEKYAQMIFRHAEQDHAMEIAKPVVTLSKTPRQKL